MAIAQNISDRLRQAIGGVQQLRAPLPFLNTTQGKGRVIAVAAQKAAWARPQPRSTSR